MRETEVKKYVKKRYSEIAQSGASCCATACCAASTTNVALQIGYSEDDLNNIPEAASMGLGCGNPVALASLQEGETVLDLGSGGGIDVFLAAKKVGIEGKAIGVDMTEDMVERSRALAKQYEYANVEFKFGEIENLPIENNSIDVIISNCVINLSPDKTKVFQEAYRVLKPTGRLLISDIVTEGELPDEIKQSFAAWASCVAGALERNQYLNTIQSVGFKDVRIVAESTYDIDVSEALRGKITSVQVEAHKKCATS
jgi:ubiquinone/menaquinone biosynthesis C-methylase UbiE